VGRVSPHLLAVNRDPGLNSKISMQSTINSSTQ